jgi:hypothetical protein
MQEKLIRYSNGPDESYIIPASAEQSWKRNFSSFAKGDINSYDREESDIFSVANGQVEAIDLTESTQ